MKTWVALLMALTALAGCIGDDDSDPVPAEPACPTSIHEDANVRILNTTDDPIVDERELAWDFSTYNVRTCDLYAVGQTPLRFAADGSPDPHGYIGELDVLADYDLATVAVLGAGGETPTAYVLDISNRTDPQVLSAIEQAGVYLVDVKLSPDARFLVTASQGLLVGPGEASELPELTANSGFTVYDLEDPRNPSYMFTIPDTQGGCHMLEVEYVGTTFVVVCVSANIRVWGFEEVQDRTFVPLGFVDYLPTLDGVPTPSSRWLPAGDPTCQVPTGCVLNPVLGSGPHDMTITQDPDGTLWMTVSHWNDGMRLVDITDAPQAVEVGAWNGEGATHYDGNVHTAMRFWANGTPYVIASPEYTYGGVVPSLWVLDTTDPATPQLVGEWYHPNEHESQGLYLTTHQWQVAPTGPDVPLEDVHVYLTMNHGGVWVLGFKEMLEGDLWGAIKGFHLTRTPIDQDTAITQNAVLNTWDVNVADGYIYGTDRATGLWVLDYTGDDHLDGLTGFA
ncbi:MAG: hypothetical protein ACPHID_06790 [Thermoplasmatota archaeon]